MTYAEALTKLDLVTDNPVVTFVKERVRVFAETDSSWPMADDYELAVAWLLEHFACERPITDLLEAILANGTIDHFEPYEVDHRPYLRVYMVGREIWAWDGPLTRHSLHLATAAMVRRGLAERS